MNRVKKYYVDENEKKNMISYAGRYRFEKNREACKNVSYKIKNKKGG